MSSLALRRKVGIALAAGAAALTLASGGQAADAPKGRAAQLQAVVDCRQQADPTARLACYDAATASLDAAEKAGDVVVVDRAQVREARRAAFGFNFAMPAFMTRDAEPDELDRITATVDSARQDASGKWVIKLSDGAVWRQIDTKRIFKDPRHGSTVEIRSASMGSFFMKIDGQMQMRVRRDN
ncbi:MAG: hypothetical protein WC068_09325 [Caulobacter sp.]